MAIVLVGPPGAGKSTIGRALAARLGTRHLDTDAMVEAQAGATIADLFVSQGEPAFRALEAQAVREALIAADEPTRGGVVSVGGGAILNAGTRDLLADHTVVWLEVDLSTAVSRVGMNTARPLLLGNVRQTMGRLMAEREPLYAQVSDMRVDTVQLTPDEIVDAILAAGPVMS